MRKLIIWLQITPVARVRAPDAFGQIFQDFLHSGLAIVEFLCVENAF